MLSKHRFDNYYKVYSTGNGRRELIGLARTFCAAKRIAVEQRKDGHRGCFVTLKVLDMR